MEERKMTNQQQRIRLMGVRNKQRLSYQLETNRRATVEQIANSFNQV